MRAGSAAIRSIRSPIRRATATAAPTNETLEFTIDRPPTAVTHNVNVVESASTGTVSAGDSDPDGDGVTVTALTGGTVGAEKAGAYGSLTINANDTYSYTANSI